MSPIDDKDKAIMREVAQDEFHKLTPSGGIPIPRQAPEPVVIDPKTARVPLWFTFTTIGLAVSITLTATGLYWPLSARVSAQEQATAEAKTDLKAKDKELVDAAKSAKLTLEDHEKRIVIQEQRAEAAVKAAEEAKRENAEAHTALLEALKEVKAEVRALRQGK